MDGELVRLTGTEWAVLDCLWEASPQTMTQLAHTLNNTCVAPPRMLIAFLENHLQADGSVTIPEVLRPYMGGKAVLTPKK